MEKIMFAWLAHKQAMTDNSCLHSVLNTAETPEPAAEASPQAAAAEGDSTQPCCRNSPGPAHGYE